MWLFVLCGSAWGASYPELGACTGTNVRLREDPGTDGRIVGKVEDRRHVFVLLGEAWVDGQKWYKIEHPTQKGIAYVAAQYVNYGWYYGHPTGKEFVKIRQTFGIFPEKARALFGPCEEDEFGNLHFEGFILHYDNERMLTHVQIETRAFGFAGIRVGDNLNSLLKLSMPAAARRELEEYIQDFTDIMNGKYEADEDGIIDGPEGWSYENKATGEHVFFGFGLNDDDEPAIDMISWSAPMGQG